MQHDIRWNNLQKSSSDNIKSFKVVLVIVNFWSKQLIIFLVINTILINGTVLVLKSELKVLIKTKIIFILLYVGE